MIPQISLMFPHMRRILALCHHINVLLPSPVETPLLLAAKIISQNAPSIWKYQVVLTARYLINVIIRH